MQEPHKPDLHPTVEAFIDAVNAHDPERIAALSAGDLLIFDASGDRIEGRNAMRELWRNRFAQVPDYRIEVRHRIAGKDGIALFGHASGTWLPQSPEEGGVCRLPAAWRIEVEEGRIMLWQEYTRSLCEPEVRGRTTERTSGARRVSAPAAAVVTEISADRTAGASEEPANRIDPADRLAPSASHESAAQVTPVPAEALIPTEAPIDPPVSAGVPTPIEAPIVTPVSAEAPTPTEAPIDPPISTEAPAPTEAPIVSPVPDEALIPTEAPIVPPVSAGAHIPTEAQIIPPVSAEAPTPTEAPIVPPASAGASSPTEAPILETERLVLRPFAAADAEALFDCCRHPELGDNAGWKPHETLEETRTVLAEVFLGKPTVWAVEERATGRLIGSVGLVADPKRENPEALMLGYWLDIGAWGRGLMHEAARRVIAHGFTLPGIATITVSCYPHNLRSKRLIERLGFRFEGVLHAAGCDHRGLMYDLLCYYLPREAWMQADPTP